MRRIALVLAVLLVTTAFAQATELGFKGGLNLANLSGDISGTKSMLTFGGGVFAAFPATPQLFIQPEVLFMMKGAKADSDDFDEKLKFTYLEIPVLFVYKFPTEGSISPALFAGPAIGILMSAKDEFEGESIDIKEFLKSTDFGVVVGAGVDIKTGEKGKVSLGGRYTVGMSNINDDVDADDFSIKNGVFSFFFGYAFPIGQ